MASSDLAVSLRLAALLSIRGGLLLECAGGHKGSIIDGTRGRRSAPKCPNFFRFICCAGISIQHFIVRYSSKYYLILSSARRFYVRFLFLSHFLSFHFYCSPLFYPFLLSFCLFICFLPFAFLFISCTFKHFPVQRRG
jgi:hypothetical protein